MKNTPLLIISTACVLINQSLGLSALAGNSFTSVYPAAEQAQVDGTAAIRAIGPLHLSEGKVVVQQNQVTVLSDAADSLADAELSGAVINAHTTNDAGGRTVSGVVIFTKGFSLAALDDGKVKDTIKGTDGVERVGRIVEVTPKMLRIKTAQGVQAFPTRFVAEVRSPRAFAFSMPELTTPTAQAPTSPSASSASSKAGSPPSVSTLPSDSSIVPGSSAVPGASAESTSAPSAVPQQPKGGQPLVSFMPTYTPAENSPPAPSQVQQLHAQLMAKHTGRRAMKTAALTAAVLGSFAIPTAIAVICPRPKTASSSSGGSGQ